MCLLYPDLEVDRVCVEISDVSGLFWASDADSCRGESNWILIDLTQLTTQVERKHPDKLRTKSSRSNNNIVPRYRYF